MLRSRPRTWVGLLLGAACALACGVTLAQELEISVSPSPVGSGARAAGMADAFVAIADDATAASWNPAGLVQLEYPEIAVVGAYNGIIEEFNGVYHQEVDGWHDTHNFDLNFLSVTYPLPFLIFDRNAVVGLYYQQKYDFSRHFEFDYDLSSVGAGGRVTTTFLDQEFEQKGSLSAITPAFAIELTHRLSLGIAVNFWESSFLGENGWETVTRNNTNAQGLMNPIWVGETVRETYRDVRGRNITVGLLWNINDRWSVGARYDSPWTGKMNYDRHRTWTPLAFLQGRNPVTAIQQIAPNMAKESRDIRFPETFAVGAACRVNDRFTVSCDVSCTDWSDFWIRGRNGNRISPINERNFDAFLFDQPKFEETYTVRLGAEYVFIPKQPDEELKRIWSLRGGIFYDEEPAHHEPDSFWGIAVGGGLLSHQRVNIDLAYQLRYGHDVNGEMIRGIESFGEDIFQSRFLISTVIYLGPKRGSRLKAKEDE